MKSWQSLREHYLTKHNIANNDNSLRHYMHSLTKLQRFNQMNYIKCNLPFVSNRAYYEHMLAKHHTKRFQHGGALTSLVAEEDQVKSFKVVKLTLKCPASQFRQPVKFIDDSILQFGDYLENAFNGTNGNVTLQLESTYINKKTEGDMIIEEGLARKQMTNTVTVIKANIGISLSMLADSLKSKLYVSLGTSGSNWRFHRFVDISCRCGEDVLINSGMMNEIMGGNEHDTKFDEDPIMNHVLKGYLESNPKIRRNFSPYGCFYVAIFNAK